MTQQAFDVVHEKDSGIGNAAMPGTRGDGSKPKESTALLSEGASLPFLSLFRPFCCDGSRLKAVEDKLHAGAGI